MIYNSASEYLATCTTIRQRIDAIDAIIDALFLVAVKAAETGNITEYSLNDGQTQIRTAYTSVASVTNSIKSFEELRIMYQNKLQPRIVRLVDSKSFNNRI